jgi:predicted RND superfamily exporter protein
MKLNGFARGVVRLRVPILVATALITAVLGYRLKDTRINADVFSYLPDKDPVVQLNRYIGKQYGGTQLAVVGLEAEDVFAPAVLDSVRRLTAELEQVDGVQWVTSLANALDIRKVDDDLHIAPLLEAGEQGVSLREYALAKPMYRGRLVSADGRVTILACRVREDADAGATARSIRRAVAGLELPERLTFAGLPFQVAEITHLVSRDVLVLVPIAAALILLALALSFRSLRGVLLPLASVLISTVWTIGIMNLFHVSFSIITNVIPVVLLATGSAYGIHVVSAFGESPPPGEGRRERAARSLSMVAVPVLLAGLTTVAGFLSFVFGSYLTMIREFGVFSSLGVLLALVVSLTFVPAVLSYLGPSAAERRRAAPARAAGDAPAAGSAAAAGPRFLGRFGGFLLRRAWLILAVGGALAAAAIAVMPLLRREVDILSYFSRRTEIRQAERLMKENFGGSTTLQVLVSGDVQDPRVLAEMKSVEDFLKSRPQLANVHSAVELLEEMSYALVDRRELPATRGEAASLFFLLEGEPVLDQRVRPDRQEALIQGTMANLNYRQLTALLKETEGFLASFQEGPCSFRLSGTALIYSRLDSALASSQLWSLLAAVGFMFLCNLLLLRSAAGALIGLVPITFTLFILFGVMGATGIPLDVATVLLGSISMGMGIDYTVHFLSRYRHELERGLDHRSALPATLATTGQAILINVITVSVGFLSLLLGSLLPLRNFGLLIVVTMVSSGAAALSLLPAVLTLGAEKLRIKARAPARRRAWGLKLQTARVNEEEKPK